jgi:hypothetical protein
LCRQIIGHRIPATESKEKGKAQYVCKVCADRRKHYTEKEGMQFVTVYQQKCDVVLCFEDCFEIFHTKALLIGNNVLR